MNININDKLLYFGAGFGLGLALGALFAPQSGQQTRRNLSNKMDDLSHKVQDRIELSGIRETANQTLQNVVEKGRNVANIGRRRLNESIETGRRKFNQSIEDDDFSER